MLNSEVLPGSCGIINQASDHIVALSIPVMNNPSNPNNNPICNKQISIHNPVTGTDTIATVTDTCQGCKFGDIDATIDLFNIIAPNGDGRVSGIQWTPIGWTVPGGSGESASTPPSASPAVPPSPSTAAGAAEAALSNAHTEEDVAAVAPPAATPSENSNPPAASSAAPAVSASVAPAMPSAAALQPSSASSCSTPSESVCSADGTQIGTCTTELTVQMGPVAAGTKCVGGYMVMANSRLRSRRG